MLNGRSSKATRISLASTLVLLGVTAPCTLTNGNLSFPAAYAQQAQPNLALNRFNPAPVGDRFFGVESPSANGEATPHVGLVGEYAFNPLVLDGFQDDGSDAEVVTGQFHLHLGATFSLGDRLNLNFNLPFALAQDGNTATVDGSALQPDTSAAVGDLRLGARLTLFGEMFDPIQAALAMYVWVPTGPVPGYTTTETVRGGPRLVLGGMIEERVVWSAMGGFEIGQEVQYGGVTQGSMAHWGAGVGVYLDDDRRLQIGPEFYMAAVTEDLVAQNLNGEVLLGFKGRPVKDIELGAAGGPGFTDAIGTPDARIILSAAYTPFQVRVKDRDGDGIEDDADACPDVPGVPNVDPKKNGCPPPGDRDNDGITDDVDACIDVPGIRTDDPRTNGCPPPPGDKDGDGIIDDVDACIDVPGVVSDDPKKNGCPPDRDEDGIIDVEDACPDLPGPKSDDPSKNGCPDRDGDGIVDPKDACPDVPGVPSPNPEKNGCPAKVIVTATEIKILQKVEFEFGKANILPVSDGLLDEVAEVLKENPDVKLVEVQGHTDNKGNDAFNERLSDQRAASVRKALVTRGIEEERLQSKGYGEKEPLETNDTDEGRAANRRVQFKILKRDKKPVEGGTPAAAPAPAAE